MVAVSYNVMLTNSGGAGVLQDASNAMCMQMHTQAEKKKTIILLQGHGSARSTRAGPSLVEHAGIRSCMLHIVPHTDVYLKLSQLFRRLCVSSCQLGPAYLRNVLICFDKYLRPCQLGLMC